MRSTLFVCLATLAALGACSAVAGEEEAAAVPQVRIGGVLWYSDYDAAVAAAKGENKPLWMHFGENPG